jgi:hypothetical protein
MSHLRDLLNDNNAVRNAYLHNWITTVRQAIKSQWKEVEQIERSVFAKVILLLSQQKLTPSHSDDSSLKLQDDETSIVTSSEGKRLTDHY